MSYAESTVLDPANGDGHRYVVDDLHGAHQQRVGLDAELGLADIGFEGQSSGVAEILSGRAAQSIRDSDPAPITSIESGQHDRMLDMPSVTRLERPCGHRAIAYQAGLCRSAEHMVPHC